MKRRVFWATVTYVFSVGFFFLFLYEILRRYGFSTEVYLFGALILMGFSWMFGTLFLSSILAPKERLDENLSTLTREIMHELNIPLSTIQANSELLRRKLQDEKSLKRLERIEGSAKRLERLYKELVYSIQKELQPIEKETFDVKQLLEERAAVLEAFERNRFALALEETERHADKIGFEKMIDNLMMNAMKYSSRDTVITLRLKSRTLEIIDRGIGMSETELLRIFERYYQAETAQKGEGIGLALVKAYCDEEGIAIKIHSQKGEGTTVTLLL